MRSDAITPAEEEWVEFVHSVGTQNGRAILIGLDVEPTLAASISAWLEDQATGQRLLPGSTVSRYRKILTRLEPPNWGGKKGLKSIRAIPG